MNKSNRTETKNGTTPVPISTPTPASPQTKRYDEGFKQEAVGNWIRSGKPGTQMSKLF